MFFRNCPKCDKEISHSNKVARNNAETWQRLCAECGLIFRNAKKNPRIYPSNCLQCGRERMYSSPNKVVNNCKSCSIAKSHQLDPNRLKGSNNPMFGKNPLEHLSPERKKELSLKHSQNARGEKNPMFGKPSPLKSGRGISGTYKGLHFRSLLELAFLEHFELEYNTLPLSAEIQEFRVDLGNGHTYCPDFVSGETVFEIKPAKLLNTSENSLKIVKGKERFANYTVVTEKQLPNYQSIRNRLHEFSELVLNKRG
jgi:hypothetical protein